MSVSSRREGLLQRKNQIWSGVDDIVQVPVSLSVTLGVEARQTFNLGISDKCLKFDGIHLKSCKPFFPFR